MCSLPPHHTTLYTLMRQRKLARQRTLPRGLSLGWTAEIAAARNAFGEEIGSQRNLICRGVSATTHTSQCASLSEVRVIIRTQRHVLPHFDEHVIRLHIQLPYNKKDGV